MNKSNPGSVKKRVDTLLSLIAKEGIISVSKKQNLDGTDLLLLHMFALLEGQSERSVEAIEVLTKRTSLLPKTSSEKYSILSMGSDERNNILTHSNPKLKLSKNPKNLTRTRRTRLTRK